MPKTNIFAFAASFISNRKAEAHNIDYIERIGSAIISHITRVTKAQPSYLFNYSFSSVSISIRTLDSYCNYPIINSESFVSIVIRTTIENEFAFIKNLFERGFKVNLI